MYLGSVSVFTKLIKVHKRKNMVSASTIWIFLNKAQLDRKEGRIHTQDGHVTSVHLGLFKRHTKSVIYFLQNQESSVLRLPIQEQKQDICGSDITNNTNTGIIWLSMSFPWLLHDLQIIFYDPEYQLL